MAQKPLAARSWAQYRGATQQGQVTMRVVRAGIWQTVVGAGLGALAAFALMTLGRHTSGLIGFGEVMVALLVGTMTVGLVAANTIGGFTDRSRRHTMYQRIGRPSTSTAATGSRCSCRRLRIQLGDMWLCAHCDHVAVG